MKDSIKICTCEQCRHIKKKRSNRKLKQKVKRLMNKRRRKCEDGSVFNFYWETPTAELKAPNAFALHFSFAISLYSTGRIFVCY